MGSRDIIIGIILLSIGAAIAFPVYRVKTPHRSIVREYNGSMVQYIHPTLDKNFNKIDDRLEALSPETPVDAIIVLHLNREKTKVLSLLKSMGIKTRSIFSRVLNGIRATIPAGLLWKIALLDDVFYIEKCVALKPMGIWENYQTRANIVHTSYTIGDPNISVAVVDTGISDSWSALSPYVIAQYDASNTGTTDDVLGHGTAVASIIAQRAWGRYYTGTTKLITTVNMDLDADSTGSWIMYAATFNVSHIIDSENEITIRIRWSGSGNTVSKVELRKGNGDSMSGWTSVASVNTPSPGTDYWLNYNIGSSSDLGRYHILVYFNDNGGEAARITLYVYFAGPEEPGSPIEGIAPGVKLVDVKASDDSTGLIVAALEGLEWIANHKDEYNISVVNLSFGTEDSLESALDNAVDNLVSQGVVVVVSAGNEGPGGHDSSPAAAPKAITVAATDINDRITSYSSDLNDNYGVRKPDIAAPGGSWYTGNILAAETNHEDPAYGSDGWPSDYTFFTGTSAAAPVVSGLAALLISALGGADYIRPWSEDKVLKIKQLLLMTASETGMSRVGGATGPPLNHGGKDNTEGYGRVNVLDAIEAELKEMKAGTMVYTYLAPVKASESHLTDFYNSYPSTKHVFARRIYLGKSPYPDDYANISISLSTAIDANIYVYRENPDENGEPVLVAKTAPGAATFKNLTLQADAPGYYYLVVKADSGSYGAYMNISYIVHDVHPPKVTLDIQPQYVDSDGTIYVNNKSKIYLNVEDISEFTTRIYLNDTLINIENGTPASALFSPGKNIMNILVNDSCGNADNITKTIFYIERVLAPSIMVSPYAGDPYSSDGWTYVNSRDSIEVYAIHVIKGNLVVDVDGAEQNYSFDGSIRKLIPVSSWSEGEHEIKAWVEDEINTTAMTAAIKLIVDNTYPQCTISHYVALGTPYVTVNAHDNTGIREIKYTFWEDDNFPSEESVFNNPVWVSAKGTIEVDTHHKYLLVAAIDLARNVVINSYSISHLASSGADIGVILIIIFAIAGAGIGFLVYRKKIKNEPKESKPLRREIL